MEFDRRKTGTLASMESPEPDKSPKGNIDAPIIPLLKAINSHPSYFTTSSCSGRISILSQPTAAAGAAVKKKAKGGTWVFITHEKADPDSVLGLLFPHNSTPPQPGNLVFRFEPLIIAIECRDMNSAQSLVGLAISSGFRESGITSVNKRVIIAIRCSIRMEVPLGESECLMVSPEYVKYLLAIANEKMETNKRRTDSFFDTLLKNGFGSQEIAEGDQRIDDNDDAIEALSQLNSLGETNLGSSEVSDINLSVERVTIIGEPVENLFLWGHSACTLDMKVLIFGGFGGMGRHARKNQCLLLEPSCGKLEVMSLRASPSPRLGHTSSMVGDRMFLIGGRADPVNILNDVWVLNTVNGEWKLLEFEGSVFPPRHRHAAAVINSRIYVFGGLNSDSISSSLYVFDTSSLEWSKIPVSGEWPCPRHSHSLVAYGSKLFMFGGHDGEKALGGLYSFDTQNCQWKQEVWAGKSPYARFSHSMFVYKNYLGIVGGCPIRQHYEELSLFDLSTRLWKHVRLNSIDEHLFVRCTASVVGDDLVVIGGGAACFAFGTKFSEPTKVNLQPIVSLGCKPMPVVTEAVKQVVNNNDDNIENNNGELHIQHERSVQMSNDGLDLNFQSVPTGTNRDQFVSSHWVLQLRKKYAKMGKDLLKKFGWLDLERKVHTKENGSHICFPVTQKFCTVYRDKQTQPPSGDALIGMESLLQLKSIAEVEVVKDFTCFTALNLLMALGAAILADEVVKARKVSNPPQKVMIDSVADLIKRKGIETELLEQLPTRWERLGDMVVLPISAFRDPVWDSIGDELWPIVAESLGTQRLARQGRVAATGTRDSTLEILVGDNGWVDHRENGILYSFDTTKCMFSWGNLSEKLRMGRFDCKDEVIVDLFAGIGYFVLPFLVRAKAKLVYACEWNPHAVEALRRNLDANSVAERCIILEGDNRVKAPKQVADRVSLGLLPTSEGSWVTAIRALRSEGGILHVHGNVKDSEEASWSDHILKSFHEISRSEGHSWEISIEHVERVKWYAPHIRHLVVDVRCRQIHRY